MRSEAAERARAAALAIAGLAALFAVGRIAPAFARVIDLAFPFFGLIGVGFVCGKSFRRPDEALGWLNLYIVYAALPALFFILISKTPLSELAHGAFVACTLGATATIFVIALTLGARRTGDLAAGAIMGAAGAYANVGYMGPGLTLLALGPQAAAPTALIFVADNLFFFAIVPLLMAAAQSGGQGLLRAARAAGIRIVTHPFNIAAVCAALAAGAQWSPPPAIERVLTMLSGSAAPCALFALGVTVAGRPFARLDGAAGALVLLKLLAHPMLVLFYLWIAGVGGVWLQTAVLMAALPPALNVYVLASQYGVAVERASNAILIGTLASVFTVTGLLLWLQG